MVVERDGLKIPRSDGYSRVKIIRSISIVHDKPKPLPGDFLMVELNVVH